jgi:hypothetical protein
MTAKIDGTNGLLQQYDYQVLTTAFTYTFAAGTTVLVINPAGTLATGTITFPASPADGMTVIFSSTQAITALTLAGNGKTIVSAVTALLANQAASYVYRLSNTSWYPITDLSASGVTSAVAGNGITVSAATGAVTISQDFYTGTSATNTSFPIGSCLIVQHNTGNVSSANLNAAISNLYINNAGGTTIYDSSSGSINLAISGTWRNRGTITGCPVACLAQRTA